MGHRGVTELHVVASMHERKKLMFELSDAFVILPGGFGTLDETVRDADLAAAAAARQADRVARTIDGYWTPFAELLDHIIAEGFARESSRRLFTMVDAVEDVIPTLLREPAPTFPTPSNGCRASPLLPCTPGHRYGSGCRVKSAAEIDFLRQHRAVLHPSRDGVMFAGPATPVRTTGTKEPHGKDQGR